jgi:hypothetical protein
MDVDMLEFELDFCTAINMFDGMEYDEAVKQAHIDIKEATK